MKNLQSFSLCFILSFLLGTHQLSADTLTSKPNIVLILVDDAALMDFGAYGGEAAMPNIDKLAKSGTMFTNYRTSPSCAPSRAMLLTGFDSHLTGVPNLPLFLPPEQVGEPGYEGVLSDKVQTVATRLKQHGYSTYITGKWHLGHTEKTLPTKRGFDRSFILDASGADNYEHKAYLPTQSKPPWFEDGQLTDLPDDFYSSRNLVDKMMQFMEEDTHKDNPFFAYLAFQAIHIPVQAPKAFIDKYEGVYDKGWDEIKKERFEKAKVLGLIPADAKAGGMLPQLTAWEAESAEEKKLKAKAMAVNAAMLEAMDFHIGRYMDYLEKKGQLANTVFVITSDNGPEASDPSLVPGMNLWLKSVGYDRAYETLGERGSWNFIGPQFASAAAGPSAYFKFYAGEGGVRVPLIISGGNLPKGQKKDAFTFVTDVTPTILDIAGIANEQPSFSGRSLYPVIKGDTNRVYQAEDAVGLEVAGHAALYKNGNKLVRNGPTYGDNVWRLYNLQNDPGEMQNLATTDKALFDDMMKEYEQYAATVGVLEMPPNYSVMGEIQRKIKVQIMDKVTPWLIGLGVLLVGLYLRRRKRKQLT